MLKLIKDNLLGVIGLAISLVGLAVELLNYFQIGPDELIKCLSIYSFLLFILSGFLIGWCVCRNYYCFVGRTRKPSQAELQQKDNEFRTSFAKCPYWMKVFLKAVLDKETAFSEPQSLMFNEDLSFLFQFVDYTTVGDQTWRYSMPEDMQEYFKAHSELLSDVKEVDIKQHARKTNADSRIISFGSRFDWWYYSDEDYIEPTPVDHSDVSRRYS